MGIVFTLFAVPCTQSHKRTSATIIYCELLRCAATSGRRTRRGRVTWQWTAVQLACRMCRCVSEDSPYRYPPTILVAIKLRNVFRVISSATTTCGCFEMSACINVSTSYEHALSRKCRTKSSNTWCSLKHSVTENDVRAA